ncbi:MAG TPA: CpsB/CapC family capsule biosynthesis tyrosine phosphatase [Solirubrobacteraceae bacterium]
MPALTRSNTPAAATLPLRRRQRGAAGQPRESGAWRGSVKGVIDLHTHILPGLDDGPETIEGSLAIARSAVAAGTRTLVATPHINRAYDLDPPRVLEAAQMLREALEREGIELELLTGGEISTRRLERLCSEELDELRLGDGPYLLIESPLSSGAWELTEVVERLHADGYGVLLAHPERCPGFHRDPALLQSLVARGALCSITAGALAGRFGSTVNRFALKLLREGLVHDVASDTHDTRRRSPELRAPLDIAAERLPGLDGQAQWLTEGVPAAILAGEPLPERPALPSRGWRERVLGRP